MKSTILFCCQKSAIYYQTQNRNKIKCLFKENIGRKYIMKVEVIDVELQKQYSESQKPGSIYVIDIKDDSLEPHETKNTITDSFSEKISKINLNHMAVILNEELDQENQNHKNYPNLNVYNIGILCFMTCIDCSEEGCPGKSPCSKLAVDLIRLWNSLGYNPEKKNIERDTKIKTELQEIYNRGTGLGKGLPDFIKEQILNW